MTLREFEGAAAEVSSGTDGDDEDDERGPYEHGSRARMIVQIALATGTAPSAWWDEDDATLATVMTNSRTPPNGPMTMADRSATLAVKFVADTTDAAQGIRSGRVEVAGGFQSGLDKAATVAAVRRPGPGRVRESGVRRRVRRANRLPARLTPRSVPRQPRSISSPKSSADDVGLASGEYEAMAADVRRRS